MTLLAFPAYLLGFFLILLPVILHLLKRKPTVPQNFPSFFFLKKTIVRKQRRNNLRKYLILLFRCLALLSLAFAFAYPFFSTVALTPEEATVIILDASFSTEPSQKKMQLVLDSYLDKASPEHPMLIVSVAGRTQWSGDFTEDRAALKKWAEEHKQTQQTGSFAAVLLMADSRLKSIQAGKKGIVVITDRQALPWEGVSLKNKLKNTSSITLTGEPTGRKIRNLAVNSAKITNDYTHAGQDLILSAAVQNYNSEAERGELKIYLEKKLILVKEITIPANTVFRESFRLKNESAALFPMEGKLELSAKNNEIKIDDIRYFSVNPVTPPTVYLTPRPGLEPQEFIKTAMQSRKDTRDSVGVNLLELNSKTADAAPGSEIMIVENPNAVGKNSHSVLKKQLKKGGTVVLIWRNSEEMSALLKEFGIHTRKTKLPGTHRLEMVDFEHKLFKDYMNVNAGSWFDILFFNVPYLIPPQNARVLATFANDVPALMELKHGKGKLFVLCTTLTRENTNWQTFGNFLPFWRELILYSEKPKLIQTNLTVDGSSLRMPQVEITDLATNQVLDGKEFKLEKAGNYLCGKLIYSLNVPARESNIAPLKKDFSLSALIDPQTENELRNKTEEKNETLKAAAAKHSNWRIYMLLALLFFLAELGLANRTVH